MANTKLTKAKQQEGCPFCDKPVNEPWQDHVILCSGQKHKCLTCGARFKKNSYLLKHMKRHAQSATVTQPAKKQKLSPSQSVEKAPVRIESTESTISTPGVEEDDSPSEWETQDPGNLEEVLLGSCSGTDEEEEPMAKDEDHDLEIGRIVRKKTQPVLFTGRRSEETNRDQKVHSERSTLEQSTRDAAVQTEPILYVHSTKKITTKWENGVKVKVIEKKKSLNMA